MMIAKMMLSFPGNETLILAFPGNGVSREIGKPSHTFDCSELGVLFTKLISLYLVALSITFLVPPLAPLCIRMYFSNTEALTSLVCLLNAVFNVLHRPIPLMREQFPFCYYKFLAYLISSYVSA
jgi:hypothetical protein